MNPCPDLHLFFELRSFSEENNKQIAKKKSSSATLLHQIEIFCFDQFSSRNYVECDYELIAILSPNSNGVFATVVYNVDRSSVVLIKDLKIDEFRS